jgi:hypothetical protein
MKDAHVKRLRQFELKGDQVKYDKLTNENYHFFAMKHYHNPNVKGVEEFHEDLNAQKYIKRLIRRYLQNGELKERLILNHIILFYNVFPGKAATRMLLFKQDEEAYPVLKSFLRFLDKIDGRETIEGVAFSKIQSDKHVDKVLKEI